MPFSSAQLSRERARRIAFAKPLITNAKKSIRVACPRWFGRSIESVDLDQTASRANVIV
jgi:hypothetical protein